MTEGRGLTNGDTAVLANLTGLARSGMYFFDSALVVKSFGRMQSSYTTYGRISHLAYSVDILEFMYFSSVAHGFNVRYVLPLSSLRKLWVGRGKWKSDERGHGNTLKSGIVCKSRVA